MRIGLGYNFSANTKAFNKNVAALNTSINDLNASIQNMLKGVASASNGSTKAIKNTSSALRGASDDATRLANDGETAVTKLAKLFDALDPTDLVRAPFDKAQDLINKLSESRGQFTSSITQAAIQFDKGFAGMAANAGLFGKELRKAEGQISSAARSLNMDAGELGKNFLALRKVGITPEDLGINGLQDLGRILEVTGLSGEDLGSIFTNLTRSYGFTKEGAQGFLDTFTQQVTALGVGTEAFGGLAGMLSTMDEAFATTLKAEGPEAVQKMILTTTRLGAAMTTAIGGTQQENLTHAIDLFKTLTENANTLPKMMAGLEENFSDLATQLGVALPGGFSESLEALKQGAEDPAMFAANMAKLYSELKKGGPQSDILLQQLKNTVTKELGPGFEYFFEKGDGAVAALESLQKPIEGGAKSLRELGMEGYRTGLTIDDQLARIKENFEHTFKSIAYPDAREFVKSQRQAYAEVGAAIKTLAEGKGLVLFNKQLLALGASQEQIAGVNDTLSKLTRSASLMQSGGLAAALQPFIGDTGKLSVAISAVGAASEAFSPLSEFLASVGINVSDLLVPFTSLKNLLLAGGPFGMLTPMLTALGPWGIGIGAVVVAVGALTAALWGADSAMNGAFGPIAQNIVTLIRDTLLEGVAFLQGFLTEQLTKAMEVDPQALADRITNSISLAIASLSAYLNGEAASSPLGDSLLKLLGTAKDLALRVRDIVERVIDEVPWAALTKSLLSVVVPWLKDSLWSAFTNGDNWLMLGSFLMETLVHGITRQFTMTFSVISGIRDVLTYAVESLTEFLYDKGVEIVAWLSSIFYGEEESNAWLEQAATFKEWFSALYQDFKKIMVKVGDALSFENIAAAVMDAMAYIGGALETGWGYIKDFYGLLKEGYGYVAAFFGGEFFASVVNLFKSLLPYISPLYGIFQLLSSLSFDQVTTAFDKVLSALSPLYLMVKTAFGAIMEFWGWISQFSIGEILDAVVPTPLMEAAIWLIDQLGTAWGKASSAFAEVYAEVTGYFDKLYDDFMRLGSLLVAAWPQIKAKLIALIDSFFSEWTSLNNSVSSALAAPFQTVKDVLQGIFAPAPQEGEGWWSTLSSSLASASTWLTTINAMMSGVFAPRATGDLSKSMEPIKALGAYFQKIWPDVERLIGEVKKAYVDFYGKLLQSWPKIQSTISSSIAAIFTAVASLKDKLIEVFTKLFSAESPLLALFRLFVNNAKTSFQVFYDLVASFPSSVVSAFEWIADSIGAILSKGAELVKDHFGGVTDALLGVFGTILDIFVSVFGKVTATIDGVANVFRNIAPLGGLLGRATGTNSTSSGGSAQATFDANFAKANAEGIIGQLKSEGDQTRLILREIRDAIKAGQLQAIPMARPVLASGPSARTPR